MMGSADRNWAVLRLSVFVLAAAFLLGVMACSEDKDSSVSAPPTTSVTSDTSASILANTPVSTADDTLPTVTATPALGSTCPVGASFVQSKLAWNRASDHFCLAWRDTYSNESGFRVVLKYHNSGEEFTYYVGPNVDEFYVPQSDWPTTLRLDQPCPECLLRKDYQVTLYVIRPTDEELVDRFAVQVG